ncbi:2-polyprenyl-6-methoxyphenol hydroxylase [Actinopolyspora lacussalsi subsp. righensis]|uniref:2-polyprenyl-6-methoxyphenol hydroxylase n=1 Tax=Actinopolyspora righensis TaxID=995060 RepID=A0A1I6XEU0_9ACTN|nr:FAD-dependent monooxygenase [Actinopolyspora righensis]SFT36314.1 2-polyprenyl-6-methoxyphenol hydroxylase [Actinopolyspora righensis]
MSDNIVGDRAVVLGGSMAGLLTARVLSESFAEVVVVDRDELTEVKNYRRGVPQGRHAHGLVARGQQIVESYFPGLKEDIEADGVRTGDFSSDVRWIFNGRRMKPAPSGLVCVPSIRPVLEYHVRRRTMAIPNVIFLERHDILGLETSSDGTRVLGAKVRGQDTGAAETLSADLVVDTSGKGSRTPAWLEELGYRRPDEQKVKIDLAYTTRHYQLKSDPFGTDLAIIPAATPRTPRGAFFHHLPGWGGRVELSLTGLLGDHPPTDDDGFLAFVKSLPVPEIYEAVKDAEPLDSPVTFKYPASVWRHYERLSEFPEGLLVLGDAVCSFNPIYAQGMTVAALETLVLREQLRSGALPTARGYFKAIAKLIAPAWDVSAGADLGYDEVAGRRSPKVRMVNAYVAKLQDAAVHDSTLTNAFIRVAGLVDSPQALLRPGNVIRVLRHSWRRSASPAASLPASEPPEASDKAA